MIDLVQWTAPAQVWNEAASATDAFVRAALRQPMILRFTTDTFMEEFMTLLANDPLRLGEFIAQPETWRGPAATPAPVRAQTGLPQKLNRLQIAASHASAQTTALTNALTAIKSQSSVGTTRPTPFKLYQPGHQRFYLVTACLVCRTVGMPDRVLDSGQHERATFVLRRLFPPGGGDPKKPLPAFDVNTWEEYAFVSMPSGPSWQRIAPTISSAAAVPVDGEEQLPLFAVNYSQDDGHKRRLLAGLIPVGKREAYMSAAPRASADEPPKDTQGNPIDPRMLLVRLNVTEPWKNLIERGDATQKTQQEKVAYSTTTDAENLQTGSADAYKKSMQAAREQIQTVSWYILLDLKKFLDQYVKSEHAELNAALQQTTISAGLTRALTSTDPGQVPIYTSDNVKATLLDALTAVAADDNEGKLERADTTYDRTKADPLNPNQPDPTWPSFLFPLADPEQPGPLPPAAADVFIPADPLQQAQARVDHLYDLIAQALADEPAAVAPAIPLAQQQVADLREGWFVIRCAFERPNCGALHPTMLSDKTSPFQMASFFDPDAPARPIRIALPVDTSPAGLRKFDKNTAFMISDVLCGQITRARGLGLGDLVRTVLPWPLHKDLDVADMKPCADSAGVSLGKICSLSIPIITVCALILLMIIVSILDYIFRWLPYFIMCFPLPGFKAKE